MEVTGLVGAGGEGWVGAPRPLHEGTPAQEEEQHCPVSWIYSTIMPADLFHQIFKIQICMQLQFHFISVRGTRALHLNEPKRIIDGFNEPIADFLSQ